MSKIKGFYSAVDKAAQALTRSKGTGKEFMVEVAKTKGVKPTEIQTRKLQSIADLPKMSKDEFLKELEKNPPPMLRETVIGEPLDSEVRDIAEKFMLDDAVEEVGMTRRNRHELEDEVDSVFEDKMDNEMDRYMSLARQYIMDQGEGTKFPDYKTEGGENYREILMRLPSDKAKNQERLYELEAKQRRAFPTPEEAQELSQLRESIKTAPQDYQSKHWDEPNVLAHMRVQDRVVPTYTKAQIEDIGKRMSEIFNGVDPKNLASGSPSVAVQKGVITPLEAAQFSHAKGFKNVDTTGATQKVLHVEEIQSDWHQEGRKKGYGSLSKEESDELQALLKKENDEDGLLAKDLNRARELEERAKNLVPDAPFKKNWHELAMKRLLNYAAENGYDKIAVTPGAEQAKRYNLSKQIDTVIYDEMGNLRAIDKDGRIVIAEPVVPEKLSEYVGKELADKMLVNRENRMKAKDVYRQALKSDAPEEVVDPLYQEYLSHPIEYSGLDLETGGEGMKGFYDKMIPSYLNEFGKKYSVQVSPFDIEQPSATNPNNLTLPGYAPQPVPTMQFHGFDITPEMREEITTQGLPMFSGGGAVFDPEGSDYDYDTAKASGLGATGEGENKGHWGSVTMASEEDKKLHGLPEDSYMLLKGRKHETWNKAEDAEKARGSEIVKRGSRYYSIPKKYADGGAVTASVGGQYDTQPDMRDGGNVIQGTAFKKGGKVTVSNNPDAMLMDVHDKKFGKGGALKKAIKGAQEILPSAQREENLRKMLDSSKIKERLYHATPKSFSEFKPGGADPTVSGKAIWMSTDPERQPAAHNIHNYFGSDPYKEGVNVMPLHVQATNPLVLDDPTMIEWAREVFAGGSKEFPELMAPNWVDQVRKEGYDSIQFADPYDLGDPHEIIMFEPNKIKSAIGNRGTYDTTDPDITKHNGGLAQIQRK